MFIDNYENYSHKILVKILLFYDLDPYFVVLTRKTRFK
jgi:hypothetical protein